MLIQLNNTIINTNDIQWIHFKEGEVIICHNNYKTIYQPGELTPEQIVKLKQILNVTVI